MPEGADFTADHDLAAVAAEPSSVSNSDSSKDAVLPQKQQQPQRDQPQKKKKKKAPRDLRDLSSSPKLGKGDGKSKQVLLELGHDDTEKVVARLRKEARVEGLPQRQLRKSGGSRSAFAEQLAESGRELIFRGLQGTPPTSGGADSNAAGSSAGTAPTVIPSPTKSLKSVRSPKRRVTAPRAGGGGGGGGGGADAAPRLWGGVDVQPGVAGAVSVGGDGVDGRPSSSHGRSSQPLTGGLDAPVPSTGSTTTTTTTSTATKRGQRGGGGGGGGGLNEGASQRRIQEELRRVREISRGSGSGRGRGGGGEGHNIWHSGKSSMGSGGGSAHETRADGAMSSSIRRGRGARGNALDLKDVESKLHIPVNMKEFHMAPISEGATVTETKIPGIKGLSPIHVGQDGVNSKRTVHQRSKGGATVQDSTATAALVSGLDDAPSPTSSVGSVSGGFSNPSSPLGTSGFALSVGGRSKSSGAVLTPRRDEIQKQTAANHGKKEKKSSKKDKKRDKKSSKKDKKKDKHRHRRRHSDNAAAVDLAVAGGDGSASDSSALGSPTMKELEKQKAAQLEEFFRRQRTEAKDAAAAEVKVEETETTEDPNAKNRNSERVSDLGGKGGKGGKGDVVDAKLDVVAEAAARESKMVDSKQQDAQPSASRKLREHVSTPGTDV